MSLENQCNEVRYVLSQGTHVGCSSPFSKYECVLKLWPIHNLTSTTSSFRSALKAGHHLPKIELIEFFSQFGTASTRDLAFKSLTLSQLSYQCFPILGLCISCNTETSAKYFFTYTQDQHVSNSNTKYLMDKVCRMFQGIINQFSFSLVEVHLHGVLLKEHNAAIVEFVLDFSYRKADHELKETESKPLKEKQYWRLCILKCET